MKLKDFLSSLNTINVQVSIKDSNNELICKIYADSSSVLNNDIAEKTVLSWSIITSKYITVILDTVQDEEPQENQEENTENTNENSNENTNENSNENEP